MLVVVMKNSIPLYTQWLKQLQMSVLVYSNMTLKERRKAGSEYLSRFDVVLITYDVSLYVFECVYSKAVHT